jgi:uncharacterized membrane protein (DUF373 family)
VREIIVELFSKLLKLSTPNLALIVVLVALLVVWRVLGKS